MLSYMYNMCVHGIFHNLKNRNHNWKQQAAGLEQMKECPCSQETWFYQWDDWDVKSINEFKTSLDILMKERSIGTS